MIAAPWALALAAGGARGAYQAGALLALAEGGVTFHAVSGASIGCVNGAYLVQGDGSPGHLEELCVLWRRLPGSEILRLDGAAVGRMAALLASPGRAGLVGLVAELVAGRIAILDGTPLARILDGSLDYGRIASSPVELVIALLPQVSSAYDLVTAPWRRADHVEARALGPAEVRSALLAAVAIPMVFRGATVRGRTYGDAGGSDPVPAGALHARGARRIMSVLLSDDTPQDRADFPGATLWQLRPSRAIGSDLRSTFDFSRAAIEGLIDLGHADARAALAEGLDLERGLTSLHHRGAANEALARTLPDRHPVPPRR
jgi:NTE family protein